MRIVIVGAGPGGLYFAILLKRLAPAHDIVVFERDLAADTFGWGVAFDHRMLETMRRTDLPTFQAVSHRAVALDRIAVCHRHERVEVRSEPFVGLRRSVLIDALRRRARELGVTLRFQTPVHDVRALPEADLLVGADGANSLVRSSFAERFKPALHSGRNMYCWLGISLRLDALTLAFRRTPSGVIAAHAYPIDENASSVILECDEHTWTLAGLDQRSDTDACNYLSKVFEADLGGRLLRPNGYLRWKHFLLVENAHWHYGRTVLLGDALHTVHFSTGAGTRVAIDDAVALADAFAGHRDVDAALAAFEAARRPEADADARRARASLAWFERLDRLMRLAPVDLAYRAITETRRIEPARLATLDPDFVARAHRGSGA